MFLYVQSGNSGYTFSVIAMTFLHRVVNGIVKAGRRFVLPCMRRQTILSEMADKILEALKPNRMHKKKIIFAYFVPIKVVANITSRALLILVMLMNF